MCIYIILNNSALAAGLKEISEIVSSLRYFKKFKILNFHLFISPFFSSIQHISGIVLSIPVNCFYACKNCRNLSIFLTNMPWIPGEDLSIYKLILFIFFL